MGLTSALFRGDARMEAIAVSDSSNVKSGDRGPHVKKIQIALNAIDGAGLQTDGIYGPRTAEAVLCFKRARSIINRAYQTAPDAIVGKMTIVAIDGELAALEANTGPIEVRVLTPVADQPAHRSAAAPKGGLRLAFSFSPGFLAPQFSLGPVVAINIGQTALVEIRNAKGASIVNRDPKFATVRDPATRQAATHVKTNPQTVEILGVHRGGALIVVQTPFKPSSNVDPRSHTATITVSVKENRPTVYTPTMTPHNHRPTRRWGDLLSAIEQPAGTAAGAALFALCAAKADPDMFVRAAKASEFSDKPIALRHLDWYLTDGRGQDFDEDDNIVSWVRADSGLRSKVLSIVMKNIGLGNQFSDFFSFSQTEFNSQDHRFAFGTVDRIDIDADWVTKTIKLWFKDSYEWHPVCPGFYHQFPDDVVRETNSLHAALVELKDKGAADFWMIGEATLPMSDFGLIV